MKKALSLLLLTSILLTTILSGCSEEPTSTPDSSSSVPSQETGTPETETDYLDSLGQKTFDGEIFSMVGPLNSDRQTFALEEETGEPINDALVRRDRLVEETYEVDIQTLLVEAPETIVKNGIIAGDPPYDVVLGSMIVPQKTLLLSGMLLDLRQIPYLQPDAKWWCPESAKSLELDGRLFMTTGPITPQFYFAPAVMAYNHTLADNLNLPDIDSIVLEGNWTLDLFETYTASASQDLNGDGQFIPGEDQFAYAYDGGVTAVGMFVSCGNNFFGYNDDGSITVDLVSDKNLFDMERIYSILSNPTITLDGNAAMTQYGLPHKFESMEFVAGHALFAGNSISNMMQFYRDMEDDYSIIPCPKADEDQKDYRTYANPWCLGGVGIQLNILNPEKTGYILEVMAYISYETVRPEQYDGMLKTKMARNERQHLLLDLIFNNICYDLNQIFDFGGSASVANSGLTKNFTTFASRFAQVKNRIQIDIDTLLETINNNEMQ